MIHFVVVLGRPGTMRAVEAGMWRALDETSVFSGTGVLLRGPDLPWRLAAITLPDATTPVRVAEDEGSVVVFNGPVLARAGGQAQLASRLLDRFRAGGSSGVLGMLRGAFNFVGFDARTGLLHAFGEGLGMYPLYWGRDEEHVVVSNRSTTVARLLGRNRWALRPLAWVIGHATVFDGQLPAGVSYVPPGTVLTARSDGTGVTTTTAPGWSWPAPGDGPGRPNLTDQEWDETSAELVAEVAALRELGTPLELSLTGGKDSRLCLALAHAAGMQDVITTFTSGAPAGGEVATAAKVATAAGFEHVQGQDPDGKLKAIAGTVRQQVRDLAGSQPPALASTADVELRPLATERRRVPFTSLATGYDPEQTWLRVRRDVFRYEAAVCIWSSLQNRIGPHVVNIKGFGGELYRRGNGGQFRSVADVSVDELADRFVDYQQVQDPLGVLRAAEAEYQRGWLRAWVHDNARVVRRDLLPEKFYVDHRLSHWSGPLLQDTPMRLNINPLINSFAAHKMLELSPGARCRERLHEEVMRRTAPELVELPFFEDSWWDDRPARSIDAPRRAARSGVRARAGQLPGGRWAKRLAKPSSAHRARPQNPGWRLVLDDAGEVEHLFARARRRTDMDAICDMEALIGVARHADDIHAVADVKELFSCIGTALALLGQAEPVRDPLP